MKHRATAFAAATLTALAVTVAVTPQQVPAPLPAPSAEALERLATEYAAAFESVKPQPTQGVKP